MPDQPLLRPVLGPRPHERQGHGLGDGLRLPALDGAVEVDLGHAEIAAAGREHLPDEPVVRHVLLDARPNPAVIRLRRIGPQVDGELRLDPQQVAPLHRPVVGKLLPLQQAVDQGAAFVRVPVRQELPGLLGAWAACRSRPDRPGGRTPRPSTGWPAECPTASTCRRPARRFCLEESDRPAFQRGPGASLPCP